MNVLINLREGRLLGVLAIAAALVGCGGDGSASTSNSTAAVVSTAAGAPGTGRRGQPPTATIAPVRAATAPAVVGPATAPAVVGPATAPAVVGPATAPVVAPVTADPAPQISGVAAPAAKVGQAYSFQPSAKDSRNAALTYSISGAPKWTTFSATTGRLSGTPTTADVGVDPNIIVQVSNGKSSAALAAFTITVAAVGSSAGSASLSWVAPTLNTDGSALADLGGYVIHYGTVSKIYTTSITVSNPGLTRYVVEDLPAGTYYFSMTATATDGAQSSPSAEASTTIS
jgi:Putative Ig domain